MKICLKKLFAGLGGAWVLPVLIAVLGLTPAGRLSAHSFTTLYSFGAVSGGGSQPNAGLILSGKTLYGTTFQGGSSGFGTVFAVNTDCSGYTNLYSFTNGTDGANPYAGLTLSANTLYGTALYGGSSNCGTVFAINTDGSGFTNLYSFTGCTNGAFPSAGLVLSGGTLYGVTGAGIFAVNTNGTGFMTLYGFTNGTTNGSDVQCDGLVLSGSTLYGIAGIGGTNGFGMVFAANTKGFCTVFAVNTDGSGFTNLYTFNDGSDGADPYAKLILSGSTLYGTAWFNGGGLGTIFAVNTNGTGLTNLYTFTGGKDGLLPGGGLVLSGNFLYGTAVTGGISNGGTIFSISLVEPPQLTIAFSGANVILTWPTNAVGFTLESATTLFPPAWSANLPAPVVINGQNVVTNAISGTQQFYQLAQ